MVDNKAVLGMLQRFVHDGREADGSVLLLHIGTCVLSCSIMHTDHAGAKINRHKGGMDYDQKGSQTWDCIRPHELEVSCLTESHIIDCGTATSLPRNLKTMKYNKTGPRPRSTKNTSHTCNQVRLERDGPY